MRVQEPAGELFVAMQNANDLVPSLKESMMGVEKPGGDSRGSEGNWQEVRRCDVHLMFRPPMQLLVIPTTAP